MRQNWAILVVAFFMTFSYYFARQSYPPVIPQVKDEFSLSYAEASLPMSLETLAGIFLSLLVWAFMFRWGLKKVGVLGLAICSLGGVTTSLGSSFFWLGLGRLVLGIGGVLVVIVGFSMVPLWFSRERIGGAMGTKGLDMPLATVVALNFLPIIVAGYSWRISFAVSTVLLFISIAIFLLLFKEKPLQDVDGKIFTDLWNRQMWLLGMVWGFINMAVIAYITWAGTFFIELKNVPVNLAFFMASITMLTTIPLSPVAGTLSDRLGKRKIFIVIPTLLMVVSFTLMPFLALPLLFLAIALLGISSFFASPLFALTSEILSEEKAGLGFAILFTCGFTGSFLGPTIVGYVKDVFPSGEPSFFTMAIFSFIALVSASLLRTR